MKLSVISGRWSSLENGLPLENLVTTVRRMTQTLAPQSLIVAVIPRRTPFAYSASTPT